VSAHFSIIITPQHVKTESSFAGNFFEFTLLDRKFLLINILMFDP